MSNFLRATFLPTLAVAAVGGFLLGWTCRPGKAPHSPGLAPKSAATAMMRPPPQRAAAEPPTQDSLDGFGAALAQPEPVYRQRIHFAQIAAGFDRENVLRALEQERALPQESSRDRVIEALVARYAELDPAAAVGWLTQNFPAVQLQDNWLGPAVGAWISQNRGDALQWIKGLPPGKLRNHMGEMAIEQLIEIDPQTALQQLPALARQHDYCTILAFTKLAEKDLQSAVALLGQIDARSTSKAVEGIVDVWASRNPVEAFAWIGQMPAGESRQHAMGELYSKWSETDPATAGAWLMAHNDPDRANYAGGVVSAWAERDFAAARAWSEQLPPKERQEAQRQLIDRLTESDCRSAMDYAIALPDAVRSFQTSIGQTMQDWVKKDLPGAVAWTEQQTSPPIRKLALRTLLEAWGDADPRTCLEYLNRLKSQVPDNAEISSANERFQRDYEVQTRYSAVARWARQAPQELLQWSESVADAKQREEAVGIALSTLMRSDPENGKSLLDRYASTLSESSARDAATAWAESDPKAAAFWASARPTEEGCTLALDGVMYEWAQFDASTATAWLAQQPPGKVKDTVVSGLIMSAFIGPGDYISYLPPLKAVPLAQSIQAPDLREPAMTQIASYWWKQDPAAAKNWIEQSGFTAEQRAQIFHRDDRNMPPADAAQ